MGNGKRKNRETETITSADVATVDASAIVGDTPASEQAPEPQAETPKVATGPITLRKKNTHRNGYVVFGVDGMRGSVFLSKSLFVGEPLEAIVLADANPLADATRGLVFIDEALATKKREEREKREARKVNIEQRRAERKTKAEERLKKIQAQLDKMKAKEEATAAKAAAKDAANAVTAEGQSSIEQPFTDIPATV